VKCIFALILVLIIFYSTVMTDKTELSAETCDQRTDCRQWRWLQYVSLASQPPSPFLTLHPWKGIQSLPPLLGRAGRKTRFGIFNISLQETYLHWPVSTLQLL